MVFDWIFLGRENEVCGKTPEASADHSIFPCSTPAGLTFSREKEPPPRHLLRDAAANSLIIQF